MKINDNKTVREEATKNLLVALLKVDTGIITPLYKTMLVEVLINGKTFGELKETVKLTTGRQKVVFQNAVNSLIKALQGINEKLSSYDEHKEELLITQKYVKVLEGKINKEVSISPKLKQLLSIPIGKAGFSSRVQQICSWADVHTVSDLVGFSKREFQGLRNCGKKSIDEVDAFILKNDLSWKMKI